MQELSRRGFVSGVIGATGLAGLARSPAQTTTRAPESAPPGKGPGHDTIVGAYFSKNARQFLDVDGREPHIGVFFYGLVCAVINGDSEALLPNTTYIGHPHQARLFSAAKTTSAGEYDPYDGVKSWNLEGCRVDFLPLNAAGAVIDYAPYKHSDTVEHRGRHPWVHFNSVRNLWALTRKGIISADDRKKDKFVKSRIGMPAGHVIALPPYSELGRRAEWRARHDGAWRECASTDTLLYVRDDWPVGTKGIRAKRSTLDGSDKDFIDFELGNQQVVFTVTHATPGSTGDASLKHTQAFARLLGIDEEDYRYPSLARGCYGEPKDYVEAEWKRSSKDGHCEISWDGEG